MIKNKITNPYLVSVVVPAYKQEKTIEKDLLHILNVMDQLRHDFQIIVVVDGNLDGTYKLAKKIKSDKLMVIGYEKNYGKGYAVRFGMSQAKGDVIGFLDSGMDINPNGISLLLEHFEWYNADVIVGSKLHPVSRVNYPFSRKILSWGYRTLVRLMFGLRIRDTQVGMKFFRKKVIKAILPRLLVKQYAFDIELLAVAHYLGYKRIFEAPIELDFSGASSIHSKGFWRTIILMLWDTLAVFYRLKILKYYDNKNEKRWIKPSHKELQMII